MQNLNIIAVRPDLRCCLNSIAQNKVSQPLILCPESYENRNEILSSLNVLGSSKNKIKNYFMIDFIIEFS